MVTYIEATLHKIYPLSLEAVFTFWILENECANVPLAVSRTEKKHALLKQNISIHSKVIKKQTIIDEHGKNLIPKCRLYTY